MRMRGLADRNLKEIIRDPISILLGLVMPLVFLMLFSSLNKRLPLELFSPSNLTPGIIIFGYGFFIMFSATLLAKDKQSAFLIRLYTTPLKPSDFIFSYILPFFPLLVLQTIVCMVAGVLFGAVFSHLILATLLFLLIGLTCISLGVMLGALFTVNQVSGIGSLLVTIISLLSGAWMDLKMVGGIFYKVGYALPFAHSVDATRAVLSGASFSTITNNVIVMAIYAVVTTALAILAFQWNMRKK